ncbi:MAG: deoxyribonuclease V [Myxococcota bacterium]
MIPNHWLAPSTPAEARIAQNEMAARICLNDNFLQTIRYVGGVDVSNMPLDPAEMIYCASVVLSYPDLTVRETKTQEGQQKFPYIPGLLGFREAPTLVKAFNKLALRPDVIMVDGHGISHPRRLGVATHLGLLLDIPTIGVAKSILVGEPASTLGEEPGSMTPLVWKGQEIGMLLRSKKRCKPLIISAGHKITLTTALDLVLKCLHGYRLPEPTRQAHLAANVSRNMTSINANTLPLF